MRLAGRCGLDGIRQGGQRRVERRQLDLVALHALRREADRREQAPQAGIGGERPEQRLRRDELVRDLLHVVGRQEEQAVLGEEGTAVGPDAPS